MFYKTKAVCGVVLEVGKSLELIAHKNGDNI
jgi:hypothetical protein